jgi:signal transduction histidine kinase
LSLEKGATSHASLAKAQEAAMNAADLTRRFITFAQGGSPTMKPLEVRELLTQSVLMALSGSATRTEWKIAEDLAGIDADEGQIHQVIRNIVMNAREAMPNGGILSVDARNVVFQSDNPYSLSPGLYVRLTFRDGGGGIPAENLPRIFDPYFTTKELGAVKGMGLGLPICFSILKRHGGHITVNSTSGWSTTVTVFLPAKRTAGVPDE